MESTLPKGLAEKERGASYRQVWVQRRVWRFCYILKDVC